MLIRSSQLDLERRRVPLGDLRPSEFARSLNVRGLWVFSPRYLTVDLTGNSPPLTWQGSAAILGGEEGPAIDCSPSTTSGARLTFANTSPLNVTTGPGLSSFVRVARTATAPGSNAPYFGIGYQGWVNPFTVNLIAVSTTTLGSLTWNWNAGGTLRQIVNSTNIIAEGVPTSVVLSHAFGSRVDAYFAGRLNSSDTTNVAAPSYGGSSDILCFGYDGVNARNSQARMFTGAVFAHPLSGSEAAALEAEPYSLVEQRPLFLSMLPAAAPPPPPPPPPPAPEIAVSGNSVNIADGDATPDSADHTDFGTITEGGATVSRTFTVNNTGDATLNISGAIAPTGFTITKALASTILASGSDTLIVRLDNAVAGTKSGDIVISSDDLDEATFNFAVTGIVSPAPPPPPPPPPPPAVSAGGGKAYGKAGFANYGLIIDKRRFT